MKSLSTVQLPTYILKERFPALVGTQQIISSVCIERLFRNMNSDLATAVLVQVNVDHAASQTMVITLQLLHTKNWILNFITHGNAAISLHSCEHFWLRFLKMKAAYQGYLCHFPDVTIMAVMMSAKHAVFRTYHRGPFGDMNEELYIP